MTSEELVAMGIPREVNGKEVAGVKKLIWQIAPKDGWTRSVVGGTLYGCKDGSFEFVPAHPEIYQALLKAEGIEE